MRSLFCGFFVLITIASSAQQQQDEIRKSIFFGGGSYYIDQDQAMKLNHWLDSIFPIFLKSMIST
jgi:hypothetical protein